MNDCTAYFHPHTSRPKSRPGRVFTLWSLLVLFALILTPLASAQGLPQVKSLRVELWPEYDDPRLLVLIIGVLEAPNQEIRVPLPPGAELNAVAYATDDGRLLTAEWRGDSANGRTAVVVSVPTTQFHVEYYVDAITSGEETVVQAEIPVPDAEIAQATLIVQQPANTTSFRGNPPLGNLTQGPGGLFYGARELGPLSSGDVIRQEVRYTRLVPGLSTTPRAAITPQPVPTRVPESPSSWVPVVIGVILALIIAAAVVVWLRQQAAMKDTGRQQSEQPSAKTRPLSTTTLPRYCPNCGHPFGPNDRYCAMCGTKRA